MRDTRHHQQPPPGQAIQRWQPSAPIVSRQPMVSLSQLDPREYNILWPNATVMLLSPHHEVHVEFVQITPDDVYAGNFCDPGEFALKKKGLDKLMQAAGAEWVSRGCYFEDDGAKTGMIRYRAEARIQKSDGTWRSFVAHKVVRIDDESMRRTALNSKKCPSKPGTAQDEYVRREAFRIREHAHSMTESKAKNRVLRELLTVKQKYHETELRKPFAVPHIVYAPDYSDPEVRRLHLLAAAGAQADLYGQAALPEGAREVKEAQVRVEQMRSPEEAPVSESHEIEDDEHDEAGAIDENDGWVDEYSEAPSALDVALERLQAARTLEKCREVIADLNRRHKEKAFTPQEWERIKTVASRCLNQLNRRGE